MIRRPGGIRSVLTVCAASVALTGPGIARADSVEDAKGSFSQVQIVGLDDEMLVFAFPDGRNVQREAEKVKSIAVDTAVDAAADELTRAETLRKQGKRRDAIQLYQRVNTLSARPWVRAYATMRLVRLHDDTGELFRAYEAYARLATTHPRLAERIMPRKIPRADSRPCRLVLADIEKRLAKPQSEGLVVALRRMRSAILREPGKTKPAEPQVGESEPYIPTSRPADDDVDAPRASVSPADPGDSATGEPPIDKRAAPPEPWSPKPDAAAIVSARSALASGDIDRARALLQEYRDGGGADDDAFFLIDAEIATQAKEFRRAGLQAMKVVIEYPQSPRVPAALLLAGAANERIGRRPAALAVYRKCAAHALATEKQKQEAQARIDALRREAEAARGKERPAGGDAGPGASPPP